MWYFTPVHAKDMLAFYMLAHKQPTATAYCLKHVRKGTRKPLSLSLKTGQIVHGHRGRFQHVLIMRTPNGFFLVRSTIVVVHGFKASRTITNPFVIVRGTRGRPPLHFWSLEARPTPRHARRRRDATRRCVSQARLEQVDALA